ncbi:hypothetical protein [Cohnella zeiphila]|uniref:Uncharacterized protein n=1 Tax=Cohnella zeiphila TaxID=2761120 RepID=A0A7X0VTZ0_9BACL|nr:hypothetical protein [Cohnella zeiphila]MBB6729712.1 hypothetical protein [Cohnella zeiphila]
MEQAMDFLGRYYFLIIIAVGLIYSLFFKKSPLEKGPAKRKPVSRMPDFGGGGFPGPMTRRTSSPAPLRPRERPHEDKEPAPQPGIERRDPLAPEPVDSPAASIEPATPPAAFPAPGASAAPSSAPAMTGSPTSASSAARAGLAAALASPERGVSPAERAPAGWSRDELARAVVMAEVLGPPRARKPFRRR